MIAVTTTVKDTIDTIERFIHYHRSVGVDYFFIFLDDAKEDIFNKLSSDIYNDVYCVKCDENYWSDHPDSKSIDNLNYRQSYNANFALECCKKNGIEWIIHIDIDELIYLENGSSLDFLRRLDSSIEAIRFNLLEALPQRNHEPTHLYNQCLFKTIPEQKSIRIANKIGNTYFEKWSKDSVATSKFFRGHMLSKRISRVTSWQALSIHISNSAHLEEFDGIKLLHFDCPSVTKYVKKMDLLLKNFGKSQIQSGRVSQEYYDIENSTLTEEEKTVSKKEEYFKRFTMTENDYELFSSLGLIQQINLDFSGFTYSFANKFFKKKNNADVKKLFEIDFSEVKEIVLKKEHFIKMAHSRKINWYVQKMMPHLPLLKEMKPIIRASLLQQKVQPIKKLDAISPENKQFIVKFLSEKSLDQKLYLLACYIKKQDSEFAMSLALRARMIKPNSVKISEFIVKVLLEHGQSKDAYEICLNRKRPLIKFLIEQHHPESFIYFVKTLSEAKKSWLVKKINGLATIDEKKGDFESAKEALEFGLMVNPDGKYIKARIEKMNLL